MRLYKNMNFGRILLAELGFKKWTLSSIISRSINLALVLNKVI